MFLRQINKILSTQYISDSRSAERREAKICEVKSSKYQQSFGQAEVAYLHLAAAATVERTAIDHS